MKAVSGVMLTLFLMSTVTLVFNIQPVKASGTVYIRADGSIDPPTASISTFDNVTYTLTDDITSSGDGIIVERSNITIDGAGFTLQGSGSGYGVYLFPPELTWCEAIKNINIEGFGTGILVGPSAFSAMVFRSNIKACAVGIEEDHAMENCVISENTITECGEGIRAWGGIFCNISQNSISKGGSGIIAHFPYGRFTITGNTVDDNSGLGIGVYDAGGSTVSENIIINNNGSGILFSDLFGNNIISRNLIANNTGIGIGLSDGGDDTISNNTITGNDGDGIIIGGFSRGTKITGNILLNNHGTGVRTYGAYSTDSEIVSNTIAFNKYGAWIATPSKISHNNFINNTNQAHVDYSYGEPINAWDDGYPSGGNYWSDYTGVDARSGPYQDQAGSDGIGDTPRIIDAQNIDRYPLMNPIPFINATVDAKPDSLSWRSRLTWITAYIELPMSYDPGDIDVPTVKLNGVVQAELKPIAIRDYDGDGIPDLMVKYKAANVMPLLHMGTNRLTITGNVNSIPFQGVDTIRVNA